MLFTEILGKINAEVERKNILYSNFFHYHLVPLCLPPPQNYHTIVRVHEPKKNIF